MAQFKFSTPFKPDGEAFVRCVRREGTPRRVHNIELLMDGEVKAEICRRFGLLEGLGDDDPYFLCKRAIRLQRFLGYDYVVCPSDVGESVDSGFTWNNLVTADTTGPAELKRIVGRSYVDEHRGPVTTWAEYEAYPWPDPTKFNTRALEWFEKNLPDDMCLIGGLVGSIYEGLSFIMGYETLCMALYEQRDLVAEISRRMIDLYSRAVDVLLQFKRVKVIWGSDDLGFKTGTLISPKDLRQFVLPGHQQLAAQAHAAGRVYFMHSCGKLTAILDELIDDVKIDAKHSFEDTIEDVRQDKHAFGGRLTLLGGIDMDFICRAGEDEIRQRVRDTLDHCQPGGGYCLGTGNTVANYIPLENYLAMLDEGRRY